MPDSGMRIGKYRLEEKLGEGGMGTVFRASHSLIDYHVALKLMLPHLVEHPRLQQRFLKEAQVCVGLHHPNLVRTYDIDEDGGQLYLTMELLSGVHLAERVAQQGPMDARETARISRQVAEGLAYARSRGIIHRDVKPQNGMLADDGQVKVLDLGLAKLLGNLSDEVVPHSDIQDSDRGWLQKLQQSGDDLVTHDGRLTYVGTILGTLAFMSREQAIYPTVADVRNDIFSLGCTVFYLLTGQSIHGSRPPQEILHKLITCDQWTELPIERVGQKWAPLLEKMVAWDAKDRLASWQDVIAAIDQTFALGRPWKPDADDVVQLKRKLIQLELISEEDWQSAEDDSRTDSTLSFIDIDYDREERPRPRTPTPALQFLFRLAQVVSPTTGETILTQYQIQQILAGHAGTLRQGKHLIRESINRGWKGELFLARDTESGRKESFRLLPLEQLHGLNRQSDLPVVVNQLNACLLKLNNPHLAKLYSIELREQWLLITSEVLEGPSLREFVARYLHEQPLSNPSQLIKTAIELARGVHCLHEQGCVHLDLSPDRWLKPRQGPWCLTDPGWARLLISMDWKDMPQSAGLPPVIPPEMMEDLSQVGYSTDIYALGQIYRFLTVGEFPFRSMKLSDLARPILPQPLEAPAMMSLDISSQFPESPKPIPVYSQRLKACRLKEDWRIEWNGLIRSMTRPDPAARPGSVAQILETLEQIADLLEGYATPGSPNEAAASDKRLPEDRRARERRPTIRQRLRRLFGDGHGDVPPPSQA